MILSAIHIFPVKSLRGIACTEVELDDFGLQLDRRWMLVDEQGRFITQRQQASLALVDVTLRAQHLEFGAPGMEQLIIANNTLQESTIQVRVWDYVGDVPTVSEQADRWFSEYLELSCRLVFMPDNVFRPIDPQYAVNAANRTGFSDGFPVLLIAETSLEDLNGRLAVKGETPVPMLRFRPNLVISGALAFAEDQWKRIRIGDLEFSVVKPCSRCVIPTIDINTGLKHPEPIRTLGEYRKRDGKIYFGQNLIHSGLGKLKVGDPVTILESGF